MSHRGRDDDRPVYQGPRDYENLGAKITEVFHDISVTVKKAAGALVDDVRSAADEQRDFHRNRAPNQTPATSGNFWDNLLGTPPPHGSTSNMPDNCFCDMRGCASPLPPARDS